MSETGILWLDKMNEMNQHLKEMKDKLDKIEQNTKPKETNP